MFLPLYKRPRRILSDDCLCRATPRPTDGGVEVTADLGLGAVDLHGPASLPALAGREVENGGATTECRGSEECPTAGELDVIAVRGNRENVDSLVGHVCWPS